MAYDQRKKLIRKIEGLRGRKLISFCNFDRPSIPPNISGLTTQIASDTKEALFRVLKESCKESDKLDILLYTRGGDTNSVWPIACLIREFDPNFEVLVPFRAHSSGTLLSLAAKTIIMTRLGELSPIDPTTGNQFNPIDIDKKSRLGISVEDVSAYEKYFHQAFGHEENEKLSPKNKRDFKEDIKPFLNRLIEEIHPLALGNVHRVHLQIRQLARMLLEFHDYKGRNVQNIIEKLTTKYYSHLHMIGRNEAIDLLGRQVQKSSDDLELQLDKLLRQYEDDFALRKPFFASAFMEDNLSKDLTFVGGVVESTVWGYKFQTKGKLSQFSDLPPNVQVQLPPGQQMPIVKGLPRKYLLDINFQGWVRNKKPEGVTL